ncbi:MAG: hypothetical protein ISS70_10230 [Phycisphaerae bacterium]|nr:hypothetical protein [Phycisphaerae bacterium]
MEKSHQCLKVVIILTLALASTAAAIVDLDAQGVTDQDGPRDGVYLPGNSISLSWLVYNHGDETSADYSIEFFIGDYSIGSESSSGIEGASNDYDTGTFSLPSDIPAGEYSIRMEISCSNDNTSGNNETSGSTITIAELGPPDLSFSSLSVMDHPDDGLFYGGDSINLDCAVNNIGGTTSDSYTVEFYVDGRSIGSESRSGIAGRESDGFWPTVSLPSDLAAGSYSITAELSCSNDSDSGNNSSSASITVGKRMPPNISIVSVNAANGIYEPGDSINVGIALECSGGQTSGSIDIDFCASVDTTVSIDDYRIGSTGLGSLQPGESYRSDIMCQFPGDIPLGKYYIGIIATFPSDGELDTGTAYDPVFVYVGVPSDLLVQSVDATDGTYSSGDLIKVYSLIKNIGGQISTDYRVNYYLSRDSTITTQDYSIGYTDRAPLPPGQQHSYEATCRIPSNLSVGDYYVGVIVTCSNDYDPANNVKRDSRTIVFSQPTDIVAGRAMYQDRDGGEHPIRYALVEICDSGTDGVLATTHTDSNGNYSVRVPTDGATAQDVYVKVCTEGVSGAYPDTTSTICRVMDKVFDEIYCLKSDIYHYPEDSPLTVDMVAPDSGGEFMVFDSVVEGFGKAIEFFDIELEGIAVFWPSVEADSFYDPCAVEVHISQDDRGDRDVIIHEYGHYLTQMNGFAKGDVGDYAGHYWNADLRYSPHYHTNEQARNLAFREAWASLYSVAVQYGDTWYPYSGDAVYQDLDEESEWMLEADLEWDFDPDSDYRPGEYFENMNACALWDIFDDYSASEGHFDRLSDPGLEKIWLVSQQYKPDDILQFWDGWCENYGIEDNITRIFKAHQMPHGDSGGYQVPENRPPTADAGEDQTVLQTCEWGAWVTLSGSGYDPDGEEVVCSWSADAVHRTRSDDGAEMSAVFSVGTTTATLKVRDYQYIHEVTDEVEITVIATDPDTWTEPCF